MHEKKADNPRKKDNDQWSEWKQQLIARLVKWEARYPGCRLLFFGWEAGRDFFTLAHGECALFSNTQLKRIENLMKAVMRGKEERDRLLDALEDARDKATLIKQLNSTVLPLPEAEMKDDRDEILLGQFSEHLKREGFIAPINEKGLKKTLDLFLESKRSRELREVRARRLTAQADLMHQARGKVLAGGKRRLRRKDVMVAAREIQAAMDPEAQALLKGSDDDSDEGGHADEERRRGGVGTSAMATSHEAASDGQVLAKRKGSKFQGRGSKKDEFMTAVNRVIEVETVDEMDTLIKELEEDWADFDKEKTYKTAMATIKVAREKLEKENRSRPIAKKSKGR